MLNSVSIRHNFISEDEESVILTRIAEIIPRHRNAGPDRNAILRFGSSAPYSDHMTSNHIPAWLQSFGDRIQFDHVTINEYLKGQEIPWHIDSQGSGGEIFVLSLLSDGVLKFRKGIQREYLPMPRRGLVSFSGEARWEWEHSLKATEKRYSIVFRNSTNESGQKSAN